MTEAPARKLKLLAFGAGAVGTYIGGSLLLAGHRIVFFERPEIAGRLRRSGLRLTMQGQDHQPLAPEFADSLTTALSQGPFDAALFALKSFDTTAAIEAMMPFVSDMPPVLCLQNGVENEIRLAGTLGAERVIAGTLTSAIGRGSEPGQIVLERLRGMGVAASSISSQSLAATLAQALHEAGLNCRLYPAAGPMKWSKLLTNLVGNATSAILDMTPAEIFAHPGLYRLEMTQLRETLAVMRAQGYEVIDLPGTPVKMLALGASLPVALARPLMHRAVGSGRGAKMPSFHIDLHSGRGQSEVEWLNGAVVRFGETYSISTPANRLLTDTLVSLTRGEIPLETYARQPKRLLDVFAHQA